MITVSTTWVMAIGIPVLIFTAGASTATLTFERHETASGDSPDEYWALDNISVTQTVAPTISSISPAAAGTGASFPATITGTNLAGATAVTFSRSGVTATITSATSTSVSIMVTIAPSASIGPSDVTITTPGGSATLSGGFTVNEGGELAAIGLSPSRSLNPSSPYRIPQELPVSGAIQLVAVHPGKLVPAEVRMSRGEG